MKSTMMKLSLVAAVLMVGCVRQEVIYSHTDKYDLLTKESRGNNIDDFSDLQVKAEDMCRSQGFKDGIQVISSGPGNSNRPNGIASYTLVYQCKTPGFTDKLVTAYGEVKKQLGN